LLPFSAYLVASYSPLVTRIFAYALQPECIQYASSNIVHIINLNAICVLSTETSLGLSNSPSVAAVYSGAGATHRDATTDTAQLEGQVYVISHLWPVGEIGKPKISCIDFDDSCPLQLEFCVVSVI
jgi:hypothetical protein